MINDIELSLRQIEKYKSKKLSDLLSEAKSHFNKFIRLRDRKGDYFYCPTCRKTKRIEGDNYQACHLFPAGLYPHLRFNEDNVHGGCKSCNYFKHGVGYEYADWVREKIGVERYEHLKYLNDLHRRNGFKWDRFEVIYIIEKYKAKCKELEQSR